MSREKAARDSGEGFWRFSLSFYARPGVAPALIALQDRAGLDVNLILFALWRAVARGQTLDAAALAAAEQAVAPLRRAVVAELRGLRRRLRLDPDPDVQAMRRHIQALETAAERRVQYRLATAVPAGEAGGDREAVAAANLAAYLGSEAGSGEAETLRRAVRGFIRRV